MLPLNVIVIGPSITKSKGGMATVIHSQINHRILCKPIHYKHIVSHVEGGGITKVIIFLSAVLKLLFAEKVDLVHIHVASDTSIFRKSVFVFISRLLKKPIVIHIHGADFDSYYKNANHQVKSYIKYTLSKCTKVLVLSNYWRTFFKHQFPDIDVQVLFNGVDTSKLLSAELNIYNHDSFLFLGRLCKRKGIYDLLEAIDILVNQQNQRELMFYLAGDGDLKEVQNIIQRYHLEDNVSLLGWLNEDQKLKVFSKVSTVLLPSYSEGLPIALIEAMAVGKVIISSNVGGITDLVGEANGFLIEPGDIVGLCKCINHLRMEPQLIDQISINNKIKIKEQFDLSVIAEQLHSLYYKIAGNRERHSNLIIEEEPTEEENYVNML
ncbi:glycosyltransferase family 4 protein [Pontibacter burrus]|uniref:Glycosyltransferase family 4 protein n=1 Tax=Pontibacter burrus TaxID=2704466 RepID=A0A6B3LVY4_9BACT|nr:glycosyltransferase family 4 protein [Pontibacter burrus]NEM97750.1 glycosyltransferase family 4 protein [Pontibacter burrus]